MRYKIIHHRERAWPRPGNHMDGRVCPECSLTAHGWEGQRGHDRHHERQAEKEAALMAVLSELAKRCGMTEEQIDVLTDHWQWGAEVTGMEAIEEAAE